MKHLIMSLAPFVRYPYRGEHLPCNLCGHSEVVVLSLKDRRWKPLANVACVRCGLIRIDPMPTEDELDRYYKTEYRLEYQLARSEPPRYHLTRSRREAEGRAARLERWLKPGARVLDVGCGSGEFLALSSSKGCEVLGIEPGKVYSRYARDTHCIDVINESWSNTSIPPNSFDVLTCNQVVEHLRNPIEALRAFFNWIKPGGICYISVPDMRPSEKPSFERFHFAHVHGFTPRTLSLAMSCVGFKSMDVIPNSTSEIFMKPDSSDDESILKEYESDIDEIIAGYNDDKIINYILSGSYAKDALKRAIKWKKDHFV